MEKQHIPQCKQVNWHLSIYVLEPKLAGKINRVEDSPRLHVDVFILDKDYVSFALGTFAPT